MYIKMEVKSVNSKMKMLSIILTVLCFVQPTISFDVPENSGLRIKRKVNKCCPLNAYVDNILMKNCKYSNNTPSLHNESGKLLEDMFELVPKKFSDNNFRNKALSCHYLEYNKYMRMNGSLLTEVPNKYNRWIPLTSNKYCVDFYYDKVTAKFTLDFWAIFPSKNNTQTTSKLLTKATLISCFFMLLFLMVYLFLPELRDGKGYIQMAYVASQLMAFLLLSIFQILLSNGAVREKECVGFTLGTYFFFMSTFCWMNVLSFDIWRVFRNLAKQRQSRRKKSFKFAFYGLYAVGLPLAMTFTLGMLLWYKKDMKRYPWIVIPRIPEDGCFLQDAVKMFYLYIPMMILIISNWIFYVMTVFNIWNWKRGAQLSNQTELSHRTDFESFTLYVKLSVVMGLNWLLEFISSLYPDNQWYYISDVYNILTGLMIFVIFICKKDIWIKLRNRYNELRKRWKKRRSSSHDIRLIRQPPNRISETINLGPTV